MTLRKVVSGVMNGIANPKLSDTVNDNIAASLRAAGLNTVRQLIDRDIDFAAGTTDCFADAYVDADGREGTVSTDACTATFDTNKYKAGNYTATDYIIIEASSLTGNWSINDCTLIRISATKWGLSCATGTTAERRGKIFNTLTTNWSLITGLVAIKTPTVADQNKYLFFIKAVASSDNSFSGTLEMQSTATCSSASIDYWYFISTGNRVNNILTAGRAEIRQNGVAIHTVNRNSGSSSDSTAGTLNGASTALTTTTSMDSWIRIIDSDGSGYTNNVTATVIGISNQAITTSETITSNPGWTYTITRFAQQLTAASASDIVYDNEIFHIIPANRLPATISSSCLVPFIQDWETGADIQYRLVTIGTINNAGTNSTTGGVSNPDNAFDEDSVTAATVTTNTAFSIGRTFTARTVTSVYLNMAGVYVTGSGDLSGEIQFYNGSSWIGVGGNFNLGAYRTTRYQSLNFSVQGIRLNVTGTAATFNFSVFDLNFATSQVSTSWLPCGTTTPISNFTAFTKVPTELQIKLIPKSSSPTAGFPSIRGFALYAE